MPIPVRALLPAFLILGACAHSPLTSREDDVAQLLRLHERSLEAHRRSDAAMLVGEAPDDFLLVNRGSVQTVTRAQMLQSMSGYLGSTTFTRYEDLCPPVVKVSQDGTLAWVAVQVQAEGTQRTGDKTEPLSFVSAWVSLYEKRNGRWVSVGNASNFRE
ncbi:MAG TPA: nuclear transport factor 2 family protein [Myxococcaceae bacterium]|jgi:hypothetical protein